MNWRRLKDQRSVPYALRPTDIPTDIPTDPTIDLRIDSALLVL